MAVEDTWLANAQKQPHRQLAIPVAAVDTLPANAQMQPVNPPATPVAAVDTLPENAQKPSATNVETQDIGTWTAQIPTSRSQATPAAVDQSLSCAKIDSTAPVHHPVVTEKTDTADAHSPVRVLQADLTITHDRVPATALLPPPAAGITHDPPVATVTPLATDLPLVIAATTLRTIADHITHAETQLRTHHTPTDANLHPPSVDHHSTDNHAATGIHNLAVIQHRTVAVADPVETPQTDMSV